MRTLSALVLGAAVLGLGGFAAADDTDDYAKQIVGKWKVVKSDGDEPVGAVYEFGKDGKFSVSAKIDGKDARLDGTYTVVKDKLTTEYTIGGKDAKDVDTIKKLTAEDLEVENKDKKAVVLKREK